MGMMVAGALSNSDNKAVAAGSSVLMGAMLFVQASAISTTQPVMSAILYGMGGLSMVQAIVALDSADEDDALASGLGAPLADRSISMPDFSGDGTFSGGSNSTTASGLRDDINSNLKALKDKGFTYNSADGSMGLPGGKSVSASSMGSAKGMSKAFGVSEADAQAALDYASDLASKIKNKVSVSKIALDSSGGGYSPNSSAKSKGSYDPFAKFRNKGSKRKKASLIGMTKKTLGGDPIGVKSDDIFKMVHRAYKGLKKEGLFLPPGYKPKR